MTKPSHDNKTTIGGALALDGDTRRITAYYRDWASRYDADVAAETYHAPGMMSDWLIELAAERGLGAAKTMRVFDAGCGTGLLGIALARHGVAAITGADISPDMVELARETGVYESLYGNIDLNAPLRAELAGPFDAALAAGVFTQGHVGPGAIASLIDTLVPGGLLMISVRDGYRDLYDLDASLADLAAAGRAERLATINAAPYVGADTADYYALRRL